MNKILSFLGIAMKAGKLRSGEFACEMAIKEGDAKLIVVASDASDNTKKKFNNSCKYYKVDYLEFGTKEILSKSIGKDIRSVICITDDGFKNGILELIEKIRRTNYGKNSGS